MSLDNKISIFKRNAQYALLGIFVIIFLIISLKTEMTFPSFLAFASVILIGQFPHELLHSLASRIVVKDWGKVYFGITKGFFYTSKLLNFKEFAFITSAPFIVMEIIFTVLLLITNNSIFAIMMIAVFSACTSDIANIITQFVFRNKVPVIILHNPREENTNDK